MAVPTVSEAQNFWQSCLRTRLVDTDGISAFSPHEATITARQQLLVELAATQHVVALVAARVNDMSITARLPPEVLVHVFTSLSECDPPSSRPLLGDKRVEKYHKPYLGWIIATHVCQRWRHVALSTPHLWSRVGAPHTAIWMNEMLVRSKQVPFTLSACVEAEDQGVFNAILKAVGPDHVSRMIGLHIAAEYRPVQQEALLQNFDQRLSQVQTLLASPAPILESLTFGRLDFANQPPQNISGPILPRLRCLVYRNRRNLPLVNAPYLQNIVDLELFVEQYYMPLRKVPLLLKKLPQLENLVIKHEDTGILEHRVEEAPIERVPLDYLKSFCLESEANEHILPFLQNVVIALTACRELKLQRVSEWQLCRRIPAMIRAAFGTHATIRPSPTTIQLESDTLGDDEHALLSFQTWADGDPPSSKPRFSMHLTTEDPSHGPATRLFFRSFDLRAVTHLVFNFTGLDMGVCEALEHTFTCIPAVREITLRGYSAGALLYFLYEGMQTQGLDSDRESETEQACSSFPNLTSLCISEVDFDDTVATSINGMEMAHGDLLLEVVQQQAALNKPLHTLSISHCEGSPPPLVYLRPYVKELYYEE